MKTEAIAKLHGRKKPMILGHFARTSKACPNCVASGLSKSAGEKAQSQDALKWRFSTPKSFAIGSTISLICSALFGTPLVAGQPIDCCPSGAMQSPCEHRLKNQNRYNELKPARSCSACECASARYGAALEMSFLIWQGREDGLNFVQKNNPRLTPASNLAADVNSRMKGINFAWQPAVKLNLEQSFSDSWDFDLRWTYFNSRSKATHHASIDSQTGSGLLPIWVLPQSYKASPNVFGKAHGIWNLHLNTADLELGYFPFLTKKLSLRFNAGLKGISISQRYVVQYLDGINDGAVTLRPSKAAIRNRCLGLGPRFGFNSEWRLTKGWSILADSAASLALCVFNLKRKDFDQSISSNGLTLYDEQSKFRESFYAYRPNFEGMMGIGWNTCYGCRKQYSFNFKAAYEVQYYWEQNMMRQMAAEAVSFSAFSMRGDLHCHGITTTFRFGF